MERTVRIPDAVISKYDEVDNFALNRACIEAEISYEYLVDNIWQPGPPKQKPDGRRRVFNGIEDFRAARDIYFLWQDFSAGFRFQPVYPEEIIYRFYKSRISTDPLTLFVPWGVRPEGTFGVERYVLDKLDVLKTSISERGVNTEIMIMPADLYATDVNTISQQASDDYFSLIKQEAEERSFLVRPWSVIRESNSETYTARASELTEDEIWAILPDYIIYNAFKAARRRSGYTSDERIRQAAFAYLRERICEAEIVENVYKPIKVSLVRKDKDNAVDRGLPRLYFIPPAYQFPWLK